MQITTSNRFGFKLAWATYEQGDQAKVKITHWASGCSNTMKYVTKSEIVEVEVPLNDTLSYIQSIEKKNNGKITADLLHKKGGEYPKRVLNLLQKIEMCDSYTRPKS